MSQLVTLLDVGSHSCLAIHFTLVCDGYRVGTATHTTNVAIRGSKGDEGVDVGAALAATNHADGVVNLLEVDDRRCQFGVTVVLARTLFFW